MTRQIGKPYLVRKEGEGVFRIDIRTTRFNSQGYPLVSTESLDQTFATAMKARTYLRAEYQAQAADIATA